MGEKQQKTAVDERFSVYFLITLYDDRRIEEFTRDITIEQSVEIPPDVIPEAVLDQGIVGRVESISPLARNPSQFEVTISFRCDNTAYSIPQFLNVLYGNISLQRGIKITGLDLPARLLEAFGGPGFGIEGIRALTGVYNRPLAATALKPVGTSIEQLAAMAGAFARGGLDIIKEDHGMADVVYHPFAERVPRIQEAVTRENSRTGGKTLFFPMISGGFEQIEQQVRIAHGCGIQGFLAAPLLVGPDTVRALARRYNMALMAHPAFTGTHFHDREHGMTPAVLLGTIFRLCGADISIFPNAGGRFAFSPAECQDLARALGEPLGNLKPAFPSPAGGMKLDRIGALADQYGQDAVLLIGGALLQYSRNLTEGASVFMKAIKKYFP